MRDSLLLRAALALGGLAVVTVACGSDPKPEPATPAVTPEPSAAPATTAAAEADAAAPAAPASAGADVGSQCDALADDANTTLDAELIAVDKPCKKDADCMGVKGRACAFNCVNRAIPKIEEKDWQEALAKVQNGACKKWNEMECSKARTKPLPACQDRKPWCDKGHCALK